MILVSSQTSEEATDGRHQDPRHPDDALDEGLLRGGTQLEGWRTSDIHPAILAGLAGQSRCIFKVFAERCFVRQLRTVSTFSPHFHSIEFHHHDGLILPPRQIANFRVVASPRSSNTGAASGADQNLVATLASYPQL
jgi:hypothetical protein